ncbi:PAS domain-containing sensor histidine kinase [Deinococcus alpinitundrae]|uniref:PAS domain-containing sensor histidine kinase n=1 Tax=Deinococcus alpinitundrae TaxID=468913 RepID=UPI00137A2785|nr:ATP-binding protein [Deinococcus alpinitundrae]
MSDSARRQELHKLQSIIDASADCIKVLDLDAHLLSMNAGGMVTMELDDFSSCQQAFWPTFWEGEARLQVEAALEGARAGETRTFEGPARTFAGTLKWWEVRVSPIRDEDGSVTQLLAISRDVTDRKTAEQHLQASEQRLRGQAELLEHQATQNEQALNAFVRFTTNVASSTDLERLATAASDVVREVIAGAMSGFYLLQGDQAYPLIFSSNTPPEVQALRRSGLSLEFPLIVQALEQRCTAFAEHDQAHWQSVNYASALSITPYFREGQPYALFTTGIDRPSWSPQERAILESVSDGLGLALERADQTQQLRERTQQLEEERAALGAFVAFTEAVGSETDVQALVRQAITLLMETCGVDVVYVEREGELFKPSAWSPEYDPTLLQFLHHGFPLQHSNIAKILLQKTAAFIDQWNTTWLFIEESGLFQALAGYPYFVADELESVLLIGSQTSATWTERDKKIFQAVGRGLDLALERAEQAQELTAQRDMLKASNEELEAFTYSVSHDLRTPVRHIISFGGLLRRALPTPLTGKAARYFAIVEEAAQHLSQLIDGMLELSRTSREPFHPEPVDLGRLFEAARNEVAAAEPARQIRWQMTALPTVMGDIVLLRRVIRALLDNAVKYTRPRQEALIEVWPEDRGQTWAVFVRDNGVGFDQRYQDKLFTMFQRLHHQTDFEGAGMSLANARRIMVRHGGLMTAEGQVDQGATFGFTLPKAKF